jgi:hypothetical protein
MTVANFSDTIYASALIFGGTSITENVIVPPTPNGTVKAPEPGTLGLLVIGLFGIGIIRRRRAS